MRAGLCWGVLAVGDVVVVVVVVAVAVVGGSTDARVDWRWWKQEPKSERDERGTKNGGKPAEYRLFRQRPAEK